MVSLLLKKRQRFLLQPSSENITPLKNWRSSMKATPGRKNLVPRYMHWTKRAPKFPGKGGWSGYRRNRRKIIQIKEPTLLHIPDASTSHETTSETTDQVSSPIQTEECSSPKPLQLSIEPWRSAQIHRKPDWYSQHDDTKKKKQKLRSYDSNLLTEELCKLLQIRMIRSLNQW